MTAAGSKHTAVRLCSSGFTCSCSYGIVNPVEKGAAMSEKRLEALREALRREEEGKAFYQEAADAAHTTLGKEMFNFLIRAEESHIQKINQIYSSLEKSGSWLNMISSRETEKSAKDVCAAVRSSMADPKKGDPEDIQALQTALRMEDEGIKFYQCQADATTDMFEKKFYLLLVNEETDHWLSILDSIEFLEDPQGYFHQKEMIRSTFM